MTFWRYTTIAIVTGGASYLALGTWLGTRARWAVGLGILLATLNTVVAFGLATWANGRSNRAFMTAVLGGTLGRMVVLLGALLGGILGLALPLVPLTISLLGFFLLFLTFELAVLLARTGPEHATR